MAPTAVPKMNAQDRGFFQTVWGLSCLCAFAHARLNVFEPFTALLTLVMSLLSAKIQLKSH